MVGLSSSAVVFQALHVLQPLDRLPCRGLGIAVDLTNQRSVVVGLGDQELLAPGDQAEVCCLSSDRFADEQR